MQIQTIPTKFEVFECKVEPFEQDSKHLNAYSNHCKGILTIWMQTRTIRDSKRLNANSNHSKGIRHIQIQIRTIKTKLEAFEWKF